MRFLPDESVASSMATPFASRLPVMLNVSGRMGGGELIKIWQKKSAQKSEC